MLYQDDFSELWEAMTMIEAQEILIQLKIADYPNMENKTRKDFHRDIYSKAYPTNMENNRPLTTEQMAVMLGGRINAR